MAWKGSDVGSIDPRTGTFVGLFHPRRHVWADHFFLNGYVIEPITPEALAAADCVAVLTDHRTIDYDMVREESRLVVDTRNAIPGEHAHVLKLGAPAPTVRDRLATQAA